MTSNIAVIDYGMGNLHSVKKALNYLNVDPIITSTKIDIDSADKIILVGVGHFKKALENLRSLNIIDALNDAVLIRKKPILGICLGMQLMAKKSEEGNIEGLGWIDGEIKKFEVKNSLKYKVPHIGWNNIEITQDSPLMKDIKNNTEFYFVHSYHFVTKNKKYIVNETKYEDRFISAFQDDNIFGVQYHPEKSHDHGKTLLKNFIEI
ncbi:MAG: imidazole glycerol phosphate synthase subunit HisH [SAR86 cluster bacterium]|jgi:imidazole glycerol-phosphate synthase subunit HisH|nr:imidazole glycerol phosphate synthase subunit HisH [SAR86 cluster bacterium]